MTKYALSLYVSLTLAAGPAAAQMQEAALSGKGGGAKVVGAVGQAPGLNANLPGLPNAAPGLTGTLPGGASPVIAAIETSIAQPENLRDLASNPSPAADYARKLIAAPVTPAVRKEAVKLLGEAVVARIETAVKAVSSEPRAAAFLKIVAAEFATLENRVPEAVSATEPYGERKPLPRAVRKGSVWRALKTTALTVTAVIGVAVPAIYGQEARVPPSAPISVMAQVGVVQSQGSYIQIRNANEVLARWTPDTHLFVQGDVRMDDAALRELADFLKDRHWTVVLVEDTSDGTYLDAEGREHRGLESYQYGFGQGLPLTGGFAALKNQATRLSDGSLLFISFSPRYIGVVNSDAQRAYGLDALVNDGDNLTRHAKTLLGDGKFYSAITNLITNVDAELETNIAFAAQGAQSSLAEADSALVEYARVRSNFEREHSSVARTLGAVDLASLRAQLARAERALAEKDALKAAQLAGSVSAAARAASSEMSGYETNYEAGRAAITSARSEVDALEKASSSFLDAHPNATGDLARPDVRGMRDTLTSAESSLSANPSGAKDAAAAVVSEVSRVQIALNEHAAGTDQLTAADTILAQLEGRERAKAASADLVTAKQSLRTARESHVLGKSSWSSELQTAKSTLDSAERSIAAADAAATRNAILFWSFVTLMTLLTGGTAFFLNRSARRKAAEAQAIYDDWEKQLTAMSNSNIDVLLEKVKLYGDGDGVEVIKRGYTGQSAAVAKQVRSDSNQATLLLKEARDIHRAADTLLHPTTGTPGWFVNLVRTSRSASAIRILKDEHVKPFNKSFNAAIADFNKSKDTALADVGRLEYAVTQSKTVIDGIAAGLAKAAESKGTDSLFSVPSLFATAIPAGLALVATARETVKTDPLSGIEGEAQKAKLIAADAKSLLDLIETARAKSLAETAIDETDLSARGIAALWIGTTVKALSEQAAAVADAAAKPSFKADLNFLSTGLEDIAARADHAATIARKVDTIVLSNADKAETEIVAARTEIGRVLELDPEKTMREKGDDPSTSVLEARRLAAEAKAKVAAGELDAAETAGTAASRNADDASAIAAASLQSLRTQESTLETRRTETTRLDELVPARRTVIDGIASQFAASVMQLTSGDTSHPNANGTVGDNIDEAEVAIAAAKTKTDASVKAYRAGRLLEAASLLSQAGAHQEIAALRFAEIVEKRARLDSAMAANDNTLAALDTKYRAWKTEIPGDRRSMKATMTAYEKAGKALEGARASVEAEKGDPFKAGQELAAVSAALDQVWVQVTNDRSAWDEVDRSLKDVHTQLDKATALAKPDAVTDSPEMEAAIRELTSLKSEYAAAVAASEVAHGDWPKIDIKADEITRKAAHVVATLKAEHAEAVRATEAISNAASKVREATNWTGSYGVSVPGSPGGSSLHSAKAALSNGDYDGALRYAQSAHSEAASAIQTAEREVTRLRLEEEKERQRQERARLQRQKDEDDRRERAQRAVASRSINVGGGNWGGGGGSRPGMGGSKW
jgi:hypothetical protein